MTDETRRNLSALWLSNERALAETESLRVGAESPIVRAERLLAEQDEIEAELGSDYLRRIREQLEETEPEPEPKKNPPSWRGLGAKTEFHRLAESVDGRL